jgi:hypothetical protein
MHVKERLASYGASCWVVCLADWYQLVINMAVALNVGLNGVFVSQEVKQVNYFGLFALLDECGLLANG